MQDLNTEIQPATDEVQLDEIEQISALLRGDTGESPAVEAASPEKEPEAAQQPEKAAIDYELKVPIAGGDPVTLGALKDAYQAQATHKMDLIDRENKLMAASEQTKLLMSYIREMPPHVLEAAKMEAATDYQREMSTLQEFIPEMRTEHGARQVKSALYGLADEYGVPHRTVDSISDAVTIKMMHDYATLKQAVKEARMTVKPLRSDPPRAQRPSATTQSAADEAIARAKNGSQADKLRAIDQLLR